MERSVCLWREWGGPSDGKEWHAESFSPCAKVSMEGVCLWGGKLRALESGRSEMSGVFGDVGEREILEEIRVEKREGIMEGEQR
ncbi:hypothetical protein COLO4_20131 [Corchorus olitorius]|uniref:Uncharacterized protein n=1 Tax=Corchorus olitorius TaxID=93759 RepID=A0A1R3J1L3_9ROSI|nr:hypothetical protein COLO4_20131 [Corchorus olitorius]